MERNKYEEESLEICLGHIAYKEPECKTCIKDDLNRSCDDYQPIRVFDFKITENPVPLSGTERFKRKYGEDWRQIAYGGN